MSGFSESVLERKLADLNNSQQSIQQLSLWLIHHRKHYTSVVKTWFKELGKTSANRKLTFLYLANDVVQNAKKKYPEYPKEFSTVMKKVLNHLSLFTLDDKTVNSIGRLISIWSERAIFEPKITTELSRIWKTKTLESSTNEKDRPPTPSLIPMKKKKKIESSSYNSIDDDDDNNDKYYEDNKSNEIQEGKKEKNAINGEGYTFKAVASSVSPEPEELIKALNDLENSASSDAVIREKIARLPPEVSEVSRLSTLKNAEEGENLMNDVNQALLLLSSYNTRLQQELRDRKKVEKMMVDFLSAQRELESLAEKRLETYRDKIKKVNGVKNELKSHILSLPDLTQLPDVRRGDLAPLPSPGDLFTSK